MKYILSYENEQESLIERLLKVRGVSDTPDAFLRPSFETYRNSPFLLHDMEKAVQRIITAMKNKEKIMIFGDYDVDGVTASYLLYSGMTEHMGYNLVSIQYPDRAKDGYGLKNHHLDDIKSKGVTLVITVDNGITSVNEANYAKEIGIDLIITDHHHPLEQLPDSYALINPLVSPEYPFKSIAGVGVSFKLLCALLERSQMTKEQKTRIFNKYVPLVAIGTVADVVPLIGENRLLVKKGLDIINHKPDHLPVSLKHFLAYLNLKEQVDTHHIGFVIGPRINANGRIGTPYDSLKALLYEGEKQREHLDKLEEVNTERRRLQEQALKTAEKTMSIEGKMLICADESFHEGVVGIVAGRLTDKYNKPCMILKIDEERGLAVASLRGPSYFDVIGMISKAGHLLERFGGHKCAGGLTVKLENLDALRSFFCIHCDEFIQEEDLEKIVNVDTKLYPHERVPEILNQVQLLAPFGEGNREPLLLLEKASITKAEKVGQKAKTHLKIGLSWGGVSCTAIFRGKGDEYDPEMIGKLGNFTGRVKKDTYNGGFYLDGEAYDL